MSRLFDLKETAFGYAEKLKDAIVVCWKRLAEELHFGIGENAVFENWILLGMHKRPQVLEVVRDAVTPA